MRRLTLATAALVAACSTGSPVAAPTPTPTPAVTPSPSAAPTPSPTPACRVGEPLRRGASVSVIGDSYSTGYGGRPWGSFLAARTGLTVHVNAADGSGYTVPGHGGGNPPNPYFADQVPKLRAQRPALVIVMGSRNDLGSTGVDFVPTVRQVLSSVTRTVPDVPVLVVGSFWNDDHPDAEMLYIHWVLRRVAGQLPCASFLDPIAEGWFVGHHELFGPDGEHPSEAGSSYVADRYLVHLRNVGYLPVRG